MIKRFILFLIWTAAAIWGGVNIWSKMYAPIIHSGQPRFSTSTIMHLVVHSDATVSVASCGQFLLWREDTTDIIIGTKGNVPLGFTDCPEYYTYGPQPIKSGNWIIQRGSPVLEFHSPQPVTVEEIWNPGDAGLNQLVLTMCLIALWGVIGFYAILGFGF